MLVKITKTDIKMTEDVTRHADSLFGIGITTFFACGNGRTCHVYVVHSYHTYIDRFWNRKNETSGW